MNVSKTHLPSESSLIYGYVPNEVQTIRCGQFKTLSFRIFFRQRSAICHLLSPWHDILLFNPNGYLTCVCTTPAGSSLIQETSVDEPFNPLQTLKLVTTQASEARRSWAELTDCAISMNHPAEYPYSVNWIVGMLPQTVINFQEGEESTCQPVHVIDIGMERERSAGHVYSVKLLGSCYLGCHGIEKFFVVVISADDSMAAVLHEIDDVNKWMPGLMDDIFDWMQASLPHFDSSKYFSHALIQKNPTFVSFESDESRVSSGPNRSIVDLAKTRQMIFEWHDTWRRYALCVLGSHGVRDSQSSDAMPTMDRRQEYYSQEIIVPVQQSEKPQEGCKSKESMPNLIREQFQAMGQSDNGSEMEVVCCPRKRTGFLEKAKRGFQKLIYARQDNPKCAIEVSQLPSTKNGQPTDLGIATAGSHHSISLNLSLESNSDAGMQYLTSRKAKSKSVDFSEIEPCPVMCANMSEQLEAPGGIHEPVRASRSGVLAPIKELQRRSFDAMRRFRNGSPKAVGEASWKKATMAPKR